jgi:hypothetical protein
MSAERWPALPLGAWRDTCATLHLWSQVVGKLALPTTALVNHHWNLTLHYAARGLATLPMNYEGRTLVGLFDFVSHELILEASDGKREVVRLQPKTVAQFYGEVMQALERMDIRIPVRTKPAEVADGIAFEKDTIHRAYDADYAHAFWRALDSMRPVFEEFRARFVGKCSPVHFFWGGFDLACTRFSGRRAPERPGADAMMREAYSHEVISHGFWPGTGDMDAAFYGYCAPEPAGFGDCRVRPPAAFYSRDFKEFLLPYEAVRTSASPEKDLMAFLESTYEAGAKLASWDREALERNVNSALDAR